MSTSYDAGRRQAIEVAAEPVDGIDLGTRFLKADHASEHRAVNIYAGQIFMAPFTARAKLDELVQFRRHEERHRAIFWAELQRRDRAHCGSYRLCGFGGFVLGILTGLCGAEAIAATGAAVESVVLRHLERQVATLTGKDPAAVAAIRSIVREKRLHHDLSASQVPADGFWARVLLPTVSMSTELVMWLGMRL